MSVEKKKKILATVGWREWVALPELNIKKIKAKVDTGARSSAIHAIHIKEFEKNGEPWVRFQVHPLQRSTKTVCTAEAKIIDRRSVKSSSGKAAIRPVILTQLCLLGECWEVELTLTNRDEMGFRMLLGREAIRRRFVVDPGQSYFNGKPKRRKKRKKN